MFSLRRPVARRPLTRGGFTLIEVLVVVVIIGIVSAMLLISFNLLGTDRNLKDQATRFASLLELALDEATLQGREFGLELMRGGYRFVEFDPILEQWNEVIGDDLLRPRELEEDLEFELVIEDRRITLDDEAADTTVDKENDKRDMTEDYAPHVLIMSSGDTSPFELTLIRLVDRATISINMLASGELEIKSDDDDDF
jgi:general secretion pathway protein H